MNNNPSLPKFIEFTGVPGSGKTTVSVNLIEELRHRGYKVETKEDFDRFLENESLKSRLRIVFELRRIKNVIFALRVISLALFYGHISLFNLKLIPNFIYYFFKLKKYMASSRADYIIFDQAFFQDLSSVFYNKEIQSKKLLKSISANIVEELNVTYIICAEIPVDEAVRRIAGRKHGTSRLDAFDPGEIPAILKVQNVNFKKIWASAVNLVPVIKVETKDDPVHLGRQLIKQLNIP